MDNHKVLRLPNQCPHILIDTDISRVVDAAEQALLNSEVELYVWGNELVHLSRGGLEGIRLSQIRPPWLREQLSRVAVFETVRKDEPRACMVPTWVVDTLMSRGQWPFPALKGLTDTPMLRPDGTLLSTPGYDADTGYLYEPTIEFPPIPDQPSEQDVQGALAALCEPFYDFPFEYEHDRAAAISAVLSLLARPAIDGSVPMFGVTSTAPASGKGLLCDVVSLICTGAVAARAAVTRWDEEMSKCIVAIGIHGARMVVLDNVVGPLGTPSLANALTAPSFTGRLLGASKMVTFPMRVVWFATGNGLTYSNDLGRRVIPINLDAKCEHPEDRTTYRHPDLPPYVRSQRGHLVNAGLTLLRAFIVAGRPQHGRPRIGSFESWDDLVRSACIWAGLDDPAQGRETIRQQGDADLDALRALIEAWKTAIGTQAVKVADLQRYARTNPELHAACLVITNQERVDTRALGYALRRHQRRRVDGYMFDVEGRTGGATRWRLMTVGQSEK